MLQHCYIYHLIKLLIPLLPGYQWICLALAVRQTHSNKHAVKDIEVMLQELYNTSRKCGLKMNTRKTKITAGTTKGVYVNGIQLDQVEDYVYLGQRFTLIEKNQDNEIRSIKAGWQERFTTNMFKKKGLQPVYPFSNEI